MNVLQAARFARTSHRNYRFCRKYATAKHSDPLRILFCGSDNFSIASLEAVYEEHKQDPDTIASIDVVCKPGKRFGRGLKEIREVPIASAAHELSLPLHQIDTFTGWTPPQPNEEPINLIIAVSFGLLVPPRILNGAKFGGLNVHPSMLPDFRGPAPLHHTILHGCTTTGVTLQTLHPTKFDCGMILAQTPKPGVEIPRPSKITVPELEKWTGEMGAEMLRQYIKDRSFNPPLDPLQFTPNEEYVRRSAPKVTPEDRHINWETWTANEILQRHRAFGSLWNIAVGKQSGKRGVQEKRIIWTSGFKTVPSGPQNFAGPWPAVQNKSYEKSDWVYILTVDNVILKAKTMKVEGMVERAASTAARKAGFIGSREDWGYKRFNYVLA